MAPESDDAYLEDWWYMDNGCSNYLIGNKKWMVDFDYRKRTKIRCINDKYLNVEGMGNVRVVLNNGKATLIQNVLYVPDMESNLTSVGKLIEKGFSNTMKDNLLKFYNCNQQLIMKLEQGRNIAFKVNVKATDSKCLSATSVVKESEMWYKRFGHLNFRSLGHMNSKKLVDGIPTIKKSEKSCNVYIRGKQQRLLFAYEMPPKEKHALGLMHYDVCGLFPVPSLGGNKYFMSFIDEFTRMTWVSLISSNTRCLLNLRNSESRLRVRVVRS